MKLIKQSEIGEAALKHADYVVSEFTPIEWSNQQLKNLIEANFKGSVNWAESKFEDILKEYTEYLGIETDGSLIKQFITERNGK